MNFELSKDTYLPDTYLPDTYLLVDYVTLPPASSHHALI